MSKKKHLQKSNLKSQAFRISLYIRVSTEEQAENPEGSIKNQEMRLREYVKLKNMMEPFGEIVSVYSDPGVSAKDMNRPSFQKMLQAIERREIDLVLVTELSRFSRSTKDFAILQEFLENNDCKFMSIRENFDTSGAAGSMVLNLMASIAEFERRQTAERISHSFLARAKRGLYNGGSLPLGYKVDTSRPGVLIPVPEEVELVKLFFKTFLKEQTLAQTAKVLNEKGIKIPRQVRGSGSVRSKEIRFDSIYRLLKNKAYIGVRVFQSKNGLEEVPATWEPIIDEVTFQRVQKILEANCSRRKTHKNKFPFTLTGIIECKECGEKMSGASATGGTGKRVGYYEHVATRKKESTINYKLLDHKPRRIPALKLEPFVWEEVKNFVFNDEFSSNLLARAKAMQGINEREIKLKEFEQKSKSLDRQISLLAERIANLPEAINPEPLINKLGELQEEQKKIQKEQKYFEAKSNDKGNVISFESLELFRLGLKDLILKAEHDLDLRSKIMKLIVHKIEILTDGFEIHFRVGENHYTTALEENSSNASFFVSFSDGAGKKNPKNKKAPEVLGSGALKSNLKGAQDFLHFHAIARSTRLTNGGPFGCLI
ncbi:MAG: recombinase family protein [Bdellovibrionaceae bacterium]|nr:recombinase family protein [Pseudobdellovibrionaceae bacterium]